MSIYKTLPLVAVSGLLAFAASPAFARTPNQIQLADYSNSTSVNVDPAASKGYDKSIVSQERDQFGNAGAPIVDPVSSKGHGESIVDLQLKQIPGGDF
jgi:hypothetical protein